MSLSLFTLRKVYGYNCLAILTCYVHVLQGQLLITLQLASINLDSSLTKNLSIHVATSQLNQEDTYFMNV